MDLTCALVVAVFGMCVVVAAATAAPTPPERPSPPVPAAEPADNSKRSRTLFRSPPPSPHQFQMQGDGDIGGLYDDVMDGPPMYVAPMYDDRQQQLQNVDDPSAGDDGADPRTAGRARPGGNKPDSPVYFIRLPPQPYVYVPGYGYVSQPTRLEPPPFAQRPHSPFLDVPLSYVSNAKPVGVYTLPSQQQHPFQYQHQQQQFSGRPKPPKRPQYVATTAPPPPPSQRPDSSVYNLDKGPYVFNGRPSDAYLLQSAYDSLYSEVLQNIYP